MQVNGLQFAGRHSAGATLPWLRSSGLATATQLRLWIDGFEGNLEDLLWNILDTVLVRAGLRTVWFIVAYPTLHASLRWDEVSY